MNCDRIAPAYRWIEYAAFGRALERHRFHFLPQLRNARRALLLGDGDGRFASRLATINQHVAIESVELSANMANLAKRNLQEAAVAQPCRVRIRRADICHFPLQEGCYDLIASHFFLDCFDDEQLRSIVPYIARACVPGARWLLSEFQQPAHGWQALHARAWLSTMYAFFGAATNLKNRRLPDYENILAAAGFQLEYKYTSRAGLLCSAIWRMPATR